MYATYLRFLKPPFLAETTLTPPTFPFKDATADISVWSNVEGSLGITAGSLTTLRPLFRILRDGSLSTSRTRTRNTQQFGNNLTSDQNQVHVRSSLVLSRGERSQWRPDLELDTYEGSHSTTIYGKGNLSATNSSEEGLNPKDNQG